MAWRAIGATALLLSGIVPALAQGPMSPMAISPGTFEATTEPVSPSRASPPQAVAAPQKAVVAKTADAPATEQASAPDLQALIDKTVDAPPDVGDDTTLAKKSLSKTAEARSRVSRDHMASALNRRQLHGGYGSGYGHGFGPAPSSGSGN